MKNVKVEGIKSVGNLLCRSGRVNAYRQSFLMGYGGSCKEETWHGENSNNHKGFHSCCQSKQPWRHKAKCPRVIGSQMNSQPYKKDEKLLEVQKYKQEGKNSGEIASLMNLPLERVNKLFIYD